MIDIHAHILPEVDDGASSWEESLAILRKGIKDGVRGVVCTPHILNRLDEDTENVLTQKFRRLKEKVRKQGLPISLWLGSEMYCSADFDLRSKIATLNGNGKYILLELPLGEIPQGTGDRFFHLSLEGVTPILAHPERNTIILQNPRLAYEFVQRGVLLQLNAGSLTGDFGKRVKQVAIDLLDHQVVHLVASDCHNARSRPMILSRAYRAVEHRWGKDTAERLFRVNPYRVTTGKEITLSIPIPFDNTRSKAGKRSRLRIFGSR